MKTIKMHSNGFLLIDKPRKISSHYALKNIKRLCHGKIGHSGTLDPFATGMLAVSIGQASKFMAYQIQADKTYQAILQLGRKTDTQDLTGEIIEEKSVPQLITQNIQEIIESQFIGEIQQTPPKYSALKFKGKAYYHYARQGVEIPLPTRQVQIRHYTNIDYVADQSQIHFTVTCGSGTYIRALGEDIAQKLGTCGHLISLRRTSISPWEGQPMYSPESFDENNLLDRVQPIDKVLKHLPKIQLPSKTIEKLMQGQWTPCNIMNKDEHSLMRLYDNHSQTFYGIVNIEPPFIKPKKLIHDLPS